MIRRLSWLPVILTLAMLAFTQACAPSSMATESGESAERPPTEPTAAPAVEEPQESPAEEEPATQPTQPQILIITPTTAVENRIVEMEWPAQLRIGESDVIRLALVPARNGYTARAEFPEHDLQTQDVPVPRPNGYELYAIGRLDGVGFEIAPNGDQERFVPEGEEIAWRWTIAPRAPGQQRLTIQLLLRWVPAPGIPGAIHESLAYGRGINVQVRSFLGLSRSQAALSGVTGMLLGCGFLLAAVTVRRRTASSQPGRSQGIIQVSPPVRGPEIESKSSMSLAADERNLLRSLFASYERLVLENEFLSGYSGARTFLARPIRLDGGTDALTIVKLGPQDAIRQEFYNYETFVKDRLPPVTARIQRPPVALAENHEKSPKRKAAVQYTFIAEPGRPPVSLHHALLENPDPQLLNKLFDTFGPNWWMQRRSWTFRLGQEYDSLLPPHYVLEPLLEARVPAHTIIIDENMNPAMFDLKVGTIVQVKQFQRSELRIDGRSYSLHGMPTGGMPALRLRWMGENLPKNLSTARVSATRLNLLRDWTQNFERFGMPDPIEILPRLLEESIQGTRSVIHGDLNLENVLVGPGNLVWLIDFALTREGHPLFDFAHLESELIAHLLAKRAGDPRKYIDEWRTGNDPLLTSLHNIAGRCLLDSTKPREYWLALFMACVGALKYQNLSPLSKHCLFLTACDLVERVFKIQ